MAISQNHRLPLYVSPFLDHQAVAVVALSLKWTQVDISLHLSTSQGSTLGVVVPSTLQREGYSYSFHGGQLIHCFRLCCVGFQPQGIPQSSPISESARQDSFLQLLLSISLTHMDFLMQIYASLFGVPTARYLLKAHRFSTRRQYNTALFRRKSPQLFEIRKLQSTTITSYHWALVQPLKLHFKIALCSEPFTFLIKSTFLEHTF